MLLRSSSTPVLGSLLPSFSESPNRDFDRKISVSHGGYSSFSSFSCSSSSIGGGGGGGYSELGKNSNSRKSGLGGFRRAQSDGNLEGLAADMDEFHTSSKPLTRSLRKPHLSMLQSIPSFSVYNESNEYDEEEEEEGEEEEEEGLLKRSITIGDNITGVGSGEFCFGSQMELIKEEEGGVGIELMSFSGYDEDGQPKSPPMYLAMGLGMDVGFGGGGDGGGGGFRLPEFGEGSGDKSDIEEYYKEMIVENPGNPLFMRNYANFLYQSKGDLRGAEEYYSRVILSDPADGDTLSQYAKVVWELHHDHERASSYFERAIEVSPHDSHVHAAYASFLWETEDAEEEESFQVIGGTSVFESRVLTSASA